MGKHLKVVLIIAGIFAIYYAFTYLIVGSNTTCYFKNTLGVPCPGCGMTRAYVSLIRGDLKDAFYWHPLFLLPPILLIIVLFRKKCGLAQRLYLSNIFWTIVISIVVLVYITRMCLFFPNTAPMDINRESMLFRIVAWFLQHP